LLDLLGFKEVLKLISSKEFTDKRKWIWTIYDNIPDNMIINSTADFFIQKLIDQRNEEEVYTLSLSTILRINKIYPKFIIQYTRTMNEILAGKPWKISYFMFPLIHDAICIEEFIDLFVESIDVLKNLYINALRGKVFFDYSGKLLLQILKKDISFISDVVNFFSKGFHQDYSTLDMLWDQENYDELLTKTMGEIKKHKESYWNNTLGEYLLAHHQENAERMAKQEKWLSDYIIGHHSDIDAMEFIFNIICNFNSEQRKASTLLFCKFNHSYSDFEKIPLFPTHASWSGSEVPLLEEKISFVESIKDELVGFDYIAHRAHLADIIHNIQKEKDNVLLREFIKDK